MKKLQIVIPIIFAFLCMIGLFITDANALLPTHQCKDCHGVHDAPTPNVQLRWYSNISQGCMSCHDGAGAVEVQTHEGLSCIACHEVHDNLPNYLGGTNIKMVGFQYPAGGDNEATVVDTEDGTGAWKVAYEADSGSRSFANHDADVPNGKRICEVCHGIPSWGSHRNPTSTSMTCKQCHTHVNGWRRGGW